MTATTRSRLIGAIHGAARANGLDKDMRKDMQEQLTGKRSCVDMSVRELNLVLDRLNEGKSQFQRSSSSTAVQQKKVLALWISLHHLGVIKNSSDRALNAFVERQTGVSALRFLKPAQISKVVEALKGWAERDAGVEWVSDDNIHDRCRIIYAQVRILTRLTKTRDLDTWLAEHCNIQTHLVHIPDKFRDHIIRQLGKKIRADKAKESPM